MLDFRLKKQAHSMVIVDRFNTTSAIYPPPLLNQEIIYGTKDIGSAMWYSTHVSSTVLTTELSDPLL
jgi:hypothetical protein